MITLKYEQQKDLTTFEFDLSSIVPKLVGNLPVDRIYKNVANSNIKLALDTITLIFYFFGATIAKF